MNDPMFTAAISALAALVSCVITLVNVFVNYHLTKYNLRATHKLETEKLFFNAKAEAYHTLLRSASAYQADPSNENLLNWESDCTYAILFSSKSSEDILSTYGKSLIEYQEKPSSAVLFQELVRAQDAAMRTMKAELDTMTNSEPL